MPDEISHPEQDPAEGSRKVIDRELARQRRAQARDNRDAPTGDNERTAQPMPQEQRPM